MNDRSCLAEYHFTRRRRRICFQINSFSFIQVIIIWLNLSKVILSTGHFVNRSFCWLVIFPTWHLGNWSIFRQSFWPVILSTDHFPRHLWYWSFLRQSFWPVILTTSHFPSKSFYTLVIFRQSFWLVFLSTGQLVIFPTIHILNLAFFRQSFWQVILSTGHFPNNTSFEFGIF